MAHLVHFTIRDVDEHVVRRFKEAVARSGIKAGAAVSDALQLWLGKVAFKKAKKRSLFDLKPASFGPGSEGASEEIDEVLYGGRP